MTTSPTSDHPDQLRLLAPTEVAVLCDPYVAELEATIGYLVGQIYWELVFPAADQHQARLAVGRLSGRIHLLLNDLFPPPDGPAAKLVCVR